MKDKFIQTRDGFAEKADELADGLADKLEKLRPSPGAQEPA